MNAPTPEEAREALDKLVVYANNGWGSACPGEVDTLRRFIDAHSAPAQERQRINELLQAIREKWVASNGKDSISVSVLDTIAEVIADGSYVKAHSAPVQSIPDCKVVDVGFRWHSDTQEHIPHVLVQFTPVPANSPADACGSGAACLYKDAQIERLQELVGRGQPEPVAPEVGEGWEALAWQLCADENGEDACNELVWEGGPIPEPWGDRWLKYEGEAKRMIALVSKHASPHPAQPEPAAWVPVAERMPKSGVTVLACYTNRAGNVRRIRAEWVAAKTIESDDDSEIGEYDEATDCCYDPEGWYEKIDNWGDYSSVVVNEGEVTHWMPLPAHPDTSPPPAQPATPQGDAKDWTEVDLWAEIYRLRAAVKGPEGYDSWQDAATAERIRRVKAEAAQPAQAVTDDMVNRFLGWQLPKDFHPDGGISFDGRKDDEWNKDKTWPIGTNLLTAYQARAMLEHVIGAAQPAQAEPRPDMADAYVGAREDLATWKRRALAAEEQTRHLAAALAEEVNGPTFMGEPVLAQPKREPLTDDDITRLAESEGWHIWHEDVLREALSFGHAVVRLTLGEQG